MSEKARIDVMDDGPLIASGLDLLEDRDGRELPIKEKAALCRCGASRNKPFCDGSHREAGFKSALGASRSSVSAKQGKAVIRSLGDGPYEVCGDIELCAGDDSELSGDDPYYLCRCGASQNKPFCDGSHKQAGFTDK